MINDSRQTTLVLLVIAALVAAFWWPTLFEGKTLIHGDSLVHGLPLMELHSRALHGDASVLWSEQVYGGHPLFAEGQGAFAHPLNIFFAAFVPPVYGHNLFHAVCMLLMAVGTFGLCRTLGASVFAAGFGALAVTFAPVCTGAQQNMTISGTAAWIPWVLWTFELWLKRQDAMRAVLFGAACALMILGGYPQLFHGVVIYMAASLLLLPLRSGGRELLRDWRRLLGSGVLAVTLCIGLAAVQLLPLLELTTQSHRSHGVGLIPFMPLEALRYWRGFLYSLTQGTADPEGGYFGIVGSLLVCATASLVLIARTPPRVKDHLFATLLLVQLGIGIASPVFSFLYSHHLVPGMNFFRFMSAYFNTAVVGVAVVAALAIDGVAARLSLRRPGIRELLVAGVFLVVGGVLALHFHAPGLPWWNAASALVATVGLLVLAMMRRAILAPVLVFMLLACEIALLHLREFNFGDVTLLVPPRSLHVLEQQGRLDDFKFMERTMRPGYAFLSPRLPGLEERVPVLLASYPAMTNLLVDIASIHGALALPLASRMLLDPLLQDETEDRTAARPGQRALDLLAIRYVTANVPAQRKAFNLALYDDEEYTAVMENTAVKPRFQAYTRHVSVPSAAAAVDLLRQERDDAIIVETTDALPANESTNDSEALKVSVVGKSSTRYTFDIDAAKAGWLFVADANYPGWKARLDGAETPVYSANVLGKAVAVPVGRHRVEIYFESMSFRVGLICTVMSLLVAAGIAVVHLWKRASFSNNNPGFSKGTA